MLVWQGATGGEAGCMVSDNGLQADAPACSRGQGGRQKTVHPGCFNSENLMEIIETFN